MTKFNPQAFAADLAAFIAARKGSVTDHVVDIVAGKKVPAEAIEKFAEAATEAGISAATVSRVVDLMRAAPVLPAVRATVEKAYSEDPNRVATKAVAFSRIVKAVAGGVPPAEALKVPEVIAALARRNISANRHRAIKALETAIAAFAADGDAKLSAAVKRLLQQASK